MEVYNIWRHTDGLKALSRMLAHHGHGSKPYPLCEVNNLDPIGHLLRVRQYKIGLDRTSVDSVDKLVTQIADWISNFCISLGTFFYHSESFYMYTVVPLVGHYWWTLNLVQINLWTSDVTTWSWVNLVTSGFHCHSVAYTSGCVFATQDGGLATIAKKILHHSIRSMNQSAS